MYKWLSILGIGEDGLDGLTPIARSLLEQADLLVGGHRHLAMIPPNDRQQRLPWASPLSNTIAEIAQRRGQSICVLASGDPLCYGVGTTLLQHIPITEMTIVPTPSAFSLACARLGWSLPEVETLSLNGRDPALLQPFLYPNARLLILSAGKETPTKVADILTQRGFGDSVITLLERMGGAHERIQSSRAADWTIADTADLHTIAVTCVATPGTPLLPRQAGLPDSAYHHDGQLTKREVRAMTLAALAPIPGQLLWDVGAGCGSIGIEWMRSHPRCRAIAIEQNQSRLRYVHENATALGVPQLQTIVGKAPAALEGLPAPDAIFVGGGASAERVIDRCWQALQPSGRLVVNAVTVETELKLFHWQKQVGGTLTRLAIQRAESVGGFLGWRAMAPITQWVVIKSEEQFPG